MKEGISTPEEYTNWKAPGSERDSLQSDEAREGPSKMEVLALKTGRELDFYKDVFGENLAEELSGQDVLNLGSGGSDLKKELVEDGVESNIIGLDLDYLKRSRRAPESGGVAADMTEMPFPDKSFDTVMTSYALGYLPPERRNAALQESFRVCRDDGKVKMYPVAIADENIAKQVEAMPGVKLKKSEFISKALKSLARKIFIEEAGGNLDISEVPKILKELATIHKNTKLMEFVGQLVTRFKGKKTYTIEVSPAGRKPDDILSKLSELDIEY